jgi:hypothetical protein
LIYENQGLEKSRSISNPRKISCSANHDFFFAEPEFFLGFEIRVQIKRPKDTI